MDQQRVSGRCAAIEIDGTSYRLSPWRLGDRAEVVAHLAARRPSPLAELAANLDQFAPQHHAELMRQALRETARAREVGEPELTDYLSSADGTAHLFWLLVRDQQPQIDSLAKARTLVERELQTDLLGFQARLDRASGLFSDGALLGNFCLGRAEAATESSPTCPAVTECPGAKCIATCRGSTAGLPATSTS